MDGSTKSARYWLDKRYSRTLNGQYYAHQPVYGLHSEYSEPNQILRLARTYHLLRIFSGLKFSNFVDIGGGEGYVTSIVRDLFDAKAYNSDLSVQAGLRARELFDVQSVANDATALPFQDNSFDVVLCSEVIEHLSRPVHAISELVRICAKYLVITTYEFSSLGEVERALRRATLEFDYPHAERNWFTKEDFQILLGDNIEIKSQFRNFGGHALSYLTGQKLSRGQIEKALDLLISSTSLDPDHEGVIVIRNYNDETQHEDSRGSQWNRKFREQVFDRLLNPMIHRRQSRRPTTSIDPDLLPHLACVACSGSLRFHGNTLDCKNCEHFYPVEQGVPVLFQEDGIDQHLDKRKKPNPIEILSHGDRDAGEKIRALIIKLHRENVKTKPAVVRYLANQGLRVLWFIFRPESIGQKFQRVIGRLEGREPEHVRYLEIQLG